MIKNEWRGVIVVLVSSIVFWQCAAETGAGVKSLGAASRSATMKGDYPVFKAFGVWYDTKPDESKSTQSAGAADGESDSTLRKTFLGNFYKDQIILLEGQNAAVAANDDAELKKLLEIDADQYFDLVATVINPAVDRSGHVQKDLWAAAIAEFFAGGEANATQHKADFQGFFDAVADMDTSYNKLIDEFQLFKPEMIEGAMAEKTTMVENNTALITKLQELVATLEGGTASLVGFEEAAAAEECGVWCNLWGGVKTLGSGLWSVGKGTYQATSWAVGKAVDGGTWAVGKAIEGGTWAVGAAKDAMADDGAGTATAE